MSGSRSLERENRELRRANEILKAASAYFGSGARPPVPVVVAFIDAHRGRFGVEPICAVLTEHGVGIAPWRLLRSQDQARRRLGRCETPGCASGSPGCTERTTASTGAAKVWDHLNRVEHITVARCTVERLMRELGLQRTRRGGTVPTTTPADDAERPADLVKRDFSVPAPDRLWLADLTYVRTRSGFVYVSFVLDAYSRRVLGWQASRSLRTELALDALETAISGRRAGHGTAEATHHSDRGSQYLSIRYSQRLAESDIVASVRSRGDSYDCEHDGGCCSAGV